MRKKVLSVLTALFLIGFIIVPFAVADDPTEVTLGVRGSMGASRAGESFQMFEAYGTYQLPWRWAFSSDVVLGTYLEASIGVLNGGGDHAGAFGIGPGFDLELLNGKLEFNIGVNILGITTHQFGDVDLGSALQFSSYAGVSYKFFEHFVLGYRFSHVSNAGISNPNPGLNLHIVAFSYQF